MGRIVIPGFLQSTLTDRFVGSRQPLNEGIDIPLSDVQVFLLAFPPGTRRPMHSHEEVRLTLVRSGRMRLLLEGSTQEMGPGDFFSTCPGVLHSLEVVGEEPLNLVEVTVPAAADAAGAEAQEN